MAEKDWAASLKNEDRIIANSDRRFRYHCYSLESMSEELTYKERSIYIQDDFTEQLMVEDFIDTVRNEKLAYGLRRLTDGTPTPLSVGGAARILRVKTLFSGHGRDRSPSRSATIRRPGRSGRATAPVR